MEMDIFIDFFKKMGGLASANPNFFKVYLQLWTTFLHLQIYICNSRRFICKSRNLFATAIIICNFIRLFASMNYLFER